MTDEEKRALEWDDEWNISEDEVIITCWALNYF